MEKIEANESTKPLEGNMLFYLERTGGIAPNTGADLCIKKISG